MKLVDGKYRRISWDQAINEIGDKLLAIRKDSGPDAVFFVGSSKHNNEQAQMFRKFVSMFGTNNMDHQARICHSTTVAGVANTWGYCRTPSACSSSGRTPPRRTRSRCCMRCTRRRRARR
jgi:formate dehydrogenase major subunit